MRIKTQDESAHCKYAKQQKVYSCQKYTHQWLQSQQNNIYQPAVIYIIQFFYKQIQDRKNIFSNCPSNTARSKTHTQSHIHLGGQIKIPSEYQIISVLFCVRGAKLPSGTPQEGAVLFSLRCMSIHASGAWKAAITTASTQTVPLSLNHTKRTSAEQHQTSQRGWMCGPLGHARLVMTPSVCCPSKASR